MPNKKKNKTEIIKQLAGTERRSQMIIETSIDGFCIIGLDGKLLDANSAMVDITGYSKEELLGMAAKDLDAKQAPVQIVEHLEEIKKRGYDRFEMKLRCKDGRILDIEISTQFCELGEDKFFFSFFRDTTRRKRYEQELYLAHQELETTFDSMQENVTVVDLEFNLMSVNRTLIKNFGLPDRESVIGHKCFEIMKGRKNVCPNCAIAEAYRTKAPAFRLSTPEDEAFTAGRSFEIFAYPIMDEHGRIHGAVEFARDITERRRIEAELEKSRERVSQAQKYAYVNSMGAIVAHQLNQPLTMINMLLGRAIEQFRDESHRPSVLKNIRESLAEAKNAASIVSKCRQYSSDPSWIVTGPVVISSTTNKIVSIMSERAKHAKINIFVKAMDNLPEVEINETALEQIFFIIIQNAIDAADGKKRHKLIISARPADKKVELQFSDDCCGITPENLEKIFEPFFSTKSNGKGLGLGLEIVRRILVACGGEIRAESQPGKGTTFYLTLPISNNVNL